MKTEEVNNTVREMVRHYYQNLLTFNPMSTIYMIYLYGPTHEDIFLRIDNGIYRHRNEKYIHEEYRYSLLENALSNYMNYLEPVDKKRRRK